MKINSTPKICYVLGIYPNLSETFVQREINFFLSKGYKVFIYSLKQPSKEISDKCEVNSKIQIKYFEKTLSNSILLNLIFLFRFPGGYLKSLYLILKDVFSQTPYETFKLFILLFASCGLVSFIKKHKIDFIHSHFANASLICLFTKIITKSLRYTSTLHASADLYNRPLLLREQLKNAYKIITISEYNFDFLQRYYLKYVEHVFVVRNGIEILPYSNINRDSKKIPTLYAIGNYDFTKGYDILIKACEIVHEQKVDFELMIIGDGPQMFLIKEYLSLSKINSIVQLLGAKNHRKTLEYLKEADIFVHASVIDQGGRRDGFPTVILEAINHSVPVITTYVSAIPEFIINNETGIIVPEGNPKELSKAILRLISDPIKRESLARKAHEKLVESYDINKTFQILEKIIIE